MKILKRGIEFRKVSENSMKEIKAVSNLINQGWNYCDKQSYKIATRGEVIKKAVEEKSESIEKGKTTAKERRAGKQKKLTTKK